jgi:putative aldouronate transport system substrate-binding protein
VSSRWWPNQAAILAGGELPDMFCISVLGSLIPGMPELMASSCTDLTPYVGGDAITAYPNLANLPPTACWPRPGSRRPT